MVYWKLLEAKQGRQSGQNSNDFELFWTCSSKEYGFAIAVIIFYSACW